MNSTNSTNNFEFNPLDLDAVLTETRESHGIDPSVATPWTLHFNTYVALLLGTAAVGYYGAKKVNEYKEYLAQHKKNHQERIQRLQERKAAQENASLENTLSLPPLPPLQTPPSLKKEA